MPHDEQGNNMRANRISELFVVVSVISTGVKLEHFQRVTVNVDGRTKTAL